LKHLTGLICVSLPATQKRLPLFIGHASVSLGLRQAQDLIALPDECSDFTRRRGLAATRRVGAIFHHFSLRRFRGFTSWPQQIGNG